MNADDDRWLDEALAAPAERIDHDHFAERVLAALPPRRRRFWAMDYLVSGMAALAVTLLLVVLPAGRAALAALTDVLAPLAALVTGVDGLAAAVQQLSISGMIVGMVALCLSTGLAVAAARAE